MEPIRTVVVDDELLIRRALTVFLEEVDGISVVGTATNGLEAIERCAELSPDVVVMDVRMPVMDGVTATQRLSAEQPQIKVLAVTTFGTLGSVLPMLQSGAVGYLLKDSEPAVIVSAVRDAHRGLRVMSDEVTRTLVDALASSRPPQNPASLRDDEQLTPREAAIVRLLAKGMSNSEIARAETVTEATIKSHLSNVMSKWDVRDRVQVLIRAVQTGVVRLD